MENLSQQRDFTQDAELVTRAQRGDRSAYEQLACGYRDYVAAVVRQRVPERETDDLIQEIMARTWGKLSALKDPLAFAAWLKTLALNTCRSHNRKAARQGVSTGTEVDHIPGLGSDPLEIVLRWEQSLELREALGSLSVDNRRALILHLWNRYEYSEIADKLGVPISTVVGRIHRAKDQLRRALGVQKPARRVRRKGTAMTKRLLDELVLVPQIGHCDGVRWIVASPDGRRFASGNDAGIVVVWSLETDLQELRVNGLGFIDALCFSADGKRVAASGYDNRTAVWDVEHGIELAVLPVHGRPLQFADDGASLWSGVWSPDPENEQWVQSSLLLWDLSSKTVIRRIENMPGTPRALSPDAGTLVTVAGSPEYDRNLFVRLNDTQLIVWDLPEGRERCRLDGLPGMPAHVALDSNGRWVAATSRDPGTSPDVHVWSAESGKLLYVQPGNDGVITSLQFSPDGSTLVSTDENGLFVFWDVSTGDELRRFDKGGCTQGAAFTMDGQSLVTSAVKERMVLHASGGIAIWDVSDGSLQKLSSQKLTASISLAFSPDGERLLSAGLDHSVQSWNLKAGRLDKALDVSPADWLYSVAFHPSGRQLAVGVNRVIKDSGNTRYTGRALVIDPFTGDILHEPEGEPDGFIYKLAYSPDGSRCVASWLSGAITVWDAGWKLERRLRYREGWMSGKNLIFSPDGATLAGGSVEISARGAIERGDLTLWNIQTGEVVRRWEQEAGGLDDYAFSPDGRTLAAAMACVLPGGECPVEVRLFDVESGATIKRLQAPGIERMFTVLFSHSGETVVGLAVHGSILFWDANTGELIRVVRRDSGMGTLALSPDGRILVSTGLDGVTRLWDFASVVSGKTDTELTAIVSLLDGHWLAYTPDGYYDCSPGAQDYLLWRKGSEIFRVDQCPDRHRPGLIRSLLKPK